MKARQEAVREVSVRVRPGGRAGVAQMSCVLLSTFMYPRQGLACNRLSCLQLFFPRYHADGRRLVLPYGSGESCRTLNQGFVFALVGQKLCLTLCSKTPSAQQVCAGTLIADNVNVGGIDSPHASSCCHLSNCLNS